ncbi:MAG: ABC transporter ATP-binding protein [Bacillota bacterium]
MIMMQDIGKKYHMGDQDVYALDEVSFRVEPNEFVAIVGPSGSGKSTLMNIMGCLDAPDSGVYALDGQPVDQYSDDELALIRSKKIGFIFQSFNLLSKLNALENVELPLIYQNVKPSERRERALQALECVGLSNRINHKPTELSGGQQQRVAIARALASKPSLILADEPTGNLDSKTGKELLAIFRQLHEGGNTIVLITHDDSIAHQAKRRIYIEDGKIVRDTKEVHSC